MKTGAHERDRTVDLVLTKDVLYQLSYVGRIHMERVMGIEPTPSAWKTEVLPLNYTRLSCRINDPNPSPVGGGGRIRTYEGISQQIYSLPPLATWVPLLKMSRVFCGADTSVSTQSRDETPCGRCLF